MRLDPTEFHAGSSAHAERDDDTDRFRRPVALRVGFVLARHELDAERLVTALAQALGRPIELVRCGAYTELAETVIRAEVDVAWMPPAVYVHARRAVGVRLAATVERSGSDGYRAALLCREGVTSVVGARAAWVDPWSAAGYLMPRAMIAAQGWDAATALSSERFVGSYDTAIEALADETADIAGGYCTLGRDGRVLDASWSPTARVRVLELSSPIPSDVLCTTAALGVADAVSVESALAHPAGRAVGRARWHRPRTAGCVALRRARPRPRASLES